MLFMFTQCDQLLCEKSLSLKLSGTVYESYVMSAILDWSEVMCLRGNEIKILMTEKSTVKSICGIYVKDMRRAKDLMYAFVFNKSMNQLSMANSIPRYVHMW